MFQSTETSLPYGTGAGTNSGYSGTDTSRERATERDASGATGWLQRAVLAYAGGRGAGGATIADLRDRFPSEHHGNLSGVLSNLHKTGRLARLAQKRGRCKVYVLPEHVNERETEPFGRRGPGPLTTEERQVTVALLLDEAERTDRIVGSNLARSFRTRWEREAALLRSAAEKIKGGE